MSVTKMFLLVALSSASVALGSVLAGAAGSPVEQVVSLLKDMKSKVEADASEDDAAYQEYACWCKTNKEDHQTQVVEQREEIASLENAIESGIALEAELKAQIEALNKDIADDELSLQSATAIREKEAAAYQAEAKDMNETILLLGQAIEVLSKVQLLQKTGHPLSSASARPLVLDLHSKLQGVQGKLGSTYHKVMQKDLWDFLGAIGDEVGSSPPSNLRSSSSALAQQSPSGLVGNAAGASSYNAQSSSIYGILSQMKDDFEGDLSEATQMEQAAQASYQALKEAKVGEIAAATKQVNEKENQVAATIAAVAKGKEDLADTSEALSKDQAFLIDMEKACTTSEEEYNERVETRNEEVRAISEAITILVDDDARDLFHKSLSFVQIDERRQSKTATFVEAQQKAITSAMHQILHVAKRNENWALAALAVHMRLDDFTRVKAAMDNMTAQLKTQQQEETDKRKSCNFEIDENEDTITEKTHDGEDLNSTKLGYENTMATLNNELEELQANVATLQVGLKEAGETRKKENEAFRSSVSDQRATMNILEKALDRLKTFYMPDATLVQVSQHTAGTEDPPAVEKYAVKYEKNEGMGGVLQVMNSIITDAAKMETMLTTDEQNSQDSYAIFVNDCVASVDADNKAITAKTIQLEEATAGKSETEKALLENQGELESASQVLGSMHADCDWLVKYYDARQQAMAEEIKSIADAKAILSGADFGTEAEE